MKEIQSDTVDGWNPANQLIDSLSHYLQGFSTIPVVVGNGISAINSISLTGPTPCFGHISEQSADPCWEFAVQP